MPLLFWVKKISFLQFSGLLLMVAGIIYLELKNLQTSQGIFRQGRGKYIFYIVLYLILGGVSSIFDRLILHRFGVSPLSYLILIQIFIALNYLIFVGIKPGLFKELKQSVSQFWKVVLLISLLTVSHRYLYASAIQLAASIGSVVAVYKLSSLFNVLAAGKIFAEKDIFKKILATIIVLSGVVLLVLK